MARSTNDDLPTGWVSTRLADVAEINPRHSRDLSDSMKVSFAPMAALGENRPAFHHLEERKLGQVRKGFTHFAEGDVLFAKITPCMENGKGAVATGLRNGLGCGTTELHVIRPHAGVDPFYLYRFMQQRAFRNEAKANFTGTAGQARVPKSFIEDAEIPLPPLPEQRRIVAKLEELLGKVEGTRTHLRNVQNALKRFRQSVLNAATTGNLTIDWRADHQEEVSASNDLQSYIGNTQAISKERRRFEQTEGHELIRDVIPKSWQMPLIGDTFSIIDYRGKTPKKSSHGKRLISAKNIRMGYLSETPIEYLSDDYYKKWMTRGFPKKGDILFVTEGATMGFLALNTRGDTFALGQRTLTLQPFMPLDMRVFLYFMMSSYFQKIVQVNATGSAAVGIKGAKFKGLPIPFPPVREQQEIVRQVDQLFTLANRIEERYGISKIQVESLTQAILAKAFRGELVA
jgi:type I restriction enzyme, S subunit